MISTESIKYSLRNLYARKSRSLFTILSISVGIATIFIFVSFGLGLVGYVDEVSSESSAQLVLVQPRGGGGTGLDTTFKLTDADVNSIEKTKGVFEASGASIKAAEVMQGDTRKYVFLMGYDPDVPLVMNSWNIDILKGRWLDDNDEGRALLGYNYQIPDKIFPKGYEVGDKIEVQGQKVRIVGFLESVGNPQDDSNIYIIDDFVDDLYPDDEQSYGMILARVDTRDIEAVAERIEKNLRKSRGQEEGKEDFHVQSYESLLESFTSVLNMVVGFIILIALISVVVSAVNTANTMITSVLERVKEIGVIKSIGARNSEIFKIFLFESSFLGFVSGVSGVLVGFLITFAAGSMLDSLGWGFLSPQYSWTLFIGCILFATLTGGISGVFPAYQAAKLKPVDALRYE